MKKKVKIPDITSTDSDIDLRIFLDRGITNGGHILRVVKIDGSWTGIKYDYVLRMNKGKATEKIDKVTKTTLKSGNWDSLWVKLERLDISTLPNQEDIKDKLRKEVTTQRGKAYEVMMVLDGSSYDLQMKKDEKIIQYAFHSPWSYANTYPDVEEVRKYSNIISTLENEFQIKFRH